MSDLVEVRFFTGFHFFFLLKIKALGTLLLTSVCDKQSISDKIKHRDVTLVQTSVVAACFSFSYKDRETDSG